LNNLLLNIFFYKSMLMTH